MYYILYSKCFHKIISITRYRYYLNKVIKEKKLNFREYLVLGVEESKILEVSFISR